MYCCQLYVSAPLSVTSLFAGRSLLTPTRIYVDSTLTVLRSGLVKAAAHITGGGLPGNIVRVLPDSLAVHLDAGSWTIPPVFGWISHMVTACHGRLTFLQWKTFTILTLLVGQQMTSDIQNVKTVVILPQWFSFAGLGLTRSSSKKIGLTKAETCV